MDLMQEAKELVKASSNIVAFTGAGASTESSIPDFRSNSGLFNNAKPKYEYPPEIMLSHTFFIKHTAKFFDYYKNNMIYKDAKPNKCHIALAELERQGKLKAVITQNIDGLHQEAGTKNVLELHGSVHRNSCMICKQKYNLEYILSSKESVPICNNCGGIIKPDVVLYEETLDAKVVSSAISAIRSSDILLIIGTSLVVYPAAGLIEHYRGEKLILINKSTTPFDAKARIVINASAGDSLKSITDFLS